MTYDTYHQKLWQSGRILLSSIFIRRYGWLITAIITEANIMIRNIQARHEEDPNGSVQFTKEKAVVSIRKSNRETIFNKRRSTIKPIQLIYEENYSSEEEEAARPKWRIVDKDYEGDIEKMMAKEYTLEQLPELVKAINSQETLEVCEGVIGIRKLLITRNPPIQELLALKAEERLIQIASHESPQVRLQSCWSLANIACGMDNECEILVKKGIIPAYIRTLSSEFQPIVEQAVWGLRNLACESKQIRRKIEQAGGLRMLQQIVTKFNDKKMVELTCSAMAVICKHNPLEAIRSTISVLCCMVGCDCIQDKQTLQECLTVISEYCADDDISQENVESLLLTNIVSKVVQMLLDDDPFLAYNCLEVIRTMLCANIKITHTLQDLKFLKIAEQIISSPDPKLQRAMINILIHFSIASPRYVTILFDHTDIVTRLLQMIVLDESNESVRAKIFQFLESLGQNCGDFSVEQFYIQTELMDIGVEMLKSEDEDVVLKVLNSIYSILVRAQQHDKQQLMTEQFQKKNGLILLSRLTHHPNKQIHYKTSCIVSRFYGSAALSSLLL